MRQRKLKNLESRLENHSHLIIDMPFDERMDLGEVFEETKDRHLFVELGCGKGQFISRLAEQHPEYCYIAIECQPSAALRAMEKVDEKNLKNVRFFLKQIDDLSQYFKGDELDGIYLNFSDPWPKKKHHKRRLTHRNKLIQYAKVLKEGGFIAFKTDNTDLFDFTVEEFEALGKEGEMKRNFYLQPIALTYDLHNSPYQDENIETEYEEKFSLRGEDIKYIKAKIVTNKSHNQ